jgi:DNA-binding transcriptional MerR regulator
LSDKLLTIGELAACTGVAASALRYYEELGLLAPVRRVSGQRRYNAASVDLVGVIRFLQEVGFSLREIKRLVRSRSTARVWKELAERKVSELDATIARAAAARTAIDHALSCPRENVLECPNFWSVVRAFVGGRPLEAAHSE